MKPLFSRSEKFLAAFSAILFGFAAAWGTWDESQSHPLPAFRTFSGNLWAAWPAAALGAYIAVVVVLQRKHTKAQLYFLAGFSACAWLAMAAFVSSTATLSLAFVSGMLYRAGERISPPKN
jgi:hypothetical protein